MYRHVYVHVPFCARKCSYCDFAIVVRRDVPAASYVQSVRSELALRAASEWSSSSPVLDTLYFGGGTPSRLGASGVTSLLDLMREYFALAPSAEVTLEANPEDITPEAVRAWRAAGVNRLSVGIQSFHDNVLHWMHRVHNAEAARRAVHIARDSGLPAMSVDLIFAVPAALNRDWSRDLDEALALDVDHISLYGLTIEPHTPLGRWSARGEVVESPEEHYESEFLLANSRLSAAGYEHYEVSNFARAGQRAVHNGAYWREVPYLGLGPSAHGFDGQARRWNISAFPAWQAALTEHRDPVEGEETLSEDNRIAEQVYLGLRTRDGLVFSAQEVDDLSTWWSAGWLEWVGEPSNRRARCTPLGWLRLDKLAADLTSLRSRS